MLATVVTFSGISAAAIINGKTESLPSQPSIESTLSNVDNRSAKWFRYSVEMEENNGMPCCLISGSQASCDLEQRSNSWSVNHGDTADSEALNSETLDVLFKMQNNTISDLVLAGSACRIDAGSQTVFNLENVSEEMSIEFLHKISSHPDHEMASKATGAIALHRGELAQSTLVEYANSANKRTRKDGIFWLGEARNQAGYQALLGIINQQSRSRDERSHAVFSMSLNHSPDAEKALQQYALNHPDPHLQGEAVFWLAQHHKDGAQAVIDTVLNSSNNVAVKKKAVFALAQIESDISWVQLTDLATSSNDRNVQLEAIFWLSQDRSRDPSKVLLALTSNDQSRAVQDKAVFALSQLGHELSTPALIQLSKSSNGRFVKKQALFWLGQSSDPRALDYLEQLLTAS